MTRASRAGEDSGKPPIPLVYVSGHRNPDTDSIAAAIGYAELKRVIDDCSDCRWAW